MEPCAEDETMRALFVILVLLCCGLFAYNFYYWRSIHNTPSGDSVNGPLWRLQSNHKSTSPRIHDKNIENTVPSGHDDSTITPSSSQLNSDDLLTRRSRPNPLPNSDVLAWTKREVGALLSFNMISELNSELNTQFFCISVGGNAHYLPPPERFNPSQINLDQWLDVAVSFGAKYAVLTAQHCSGFSLWPTNISASTGFDYKYSIKYSPLMDGGYDLVQAFIDSCSKHNISPGIYYSLNQNFYLNVARGKVWNTPLRLGQEKVSQDLYNKIALAQMTELWSNYGELSELWFDGGCIPGLEEAIDELSTRLQPHAVHFNGCSKTNNLRWVGTEDGQPNYPIWSTAMETNSRCHDGHGSSHGTVFCPAETDTTLQLGIKWFYRKNIGYRTVDNLKTIYMKSVGQNSNLLLNIAPNSSGLVPDVARSIYKKFGDWIVSCFGTAVARTAGTGYSFTLNLVKPAEITKISVSEDQSKGELVTKFSISATTTDGTAHPVFTSGRSIGNKLIIDLRQSLQVTAVTLKIMEAHKTPTISDFSIYKCEV